MLIQRNIRTASIVFLSVITFGAADVQAERVAFARHLALAPDGETLAFSWAGDVWTVPVAGGAARRLTVHPAEDRSPVWSPDGRLLAFMSSRRSSGNVYVMTAEGDDIRRLTFSDNAEIPTAFSPEGEHVYYHSHKDGEVSWEPHIYRVPVAGGQSWRVMEASGSYAMPSPDGRRLAFTQGVSKWWRTGYRGSANWDLWIRDLDAGEFTQLTDFDGTDIWPVWDERGAGLYFLSDRLYTHNVWHQPLTGGLPTKITNVRTDRIRDFTVSADGQKLAYTQWDKIFVMSLPHGAAKEIDVTATSDASRTDVELKSFTNGANEVAVSPDGEEIAIVVRGEIFVIKSTPDKPTRRVTQSSARDWDVSWSPDGKALFFISDRDGQEEVYRATSAEDPSESLSDSLRFKIERVTESPETEYAPQVSPDGERLLFLRTRGDIVIRDLKTGTEEIVLEAWLRPNVIWSPDSKWIAYSLEDEEYNSDVWILSVDPEVEQRVPINVSQHPDYDGAPQWSADGQVLSFSSRRTGDDTDLYLVFLSEELGEKSSADLDDYFKEAGKAAGKRKLLEEALASGKIVLGKPDTPETQPAEEVESEPATEATEDEAEDAQAADEEEESIENRLRTLLKEFLAGPKKEPKKPEKEKEATEEEPAYEYDLDTAYRRLRRVTNLPIDQTAHVLSPGGNLLVFVSRHEGASGLFSVKWNGKDRKKIRSAGVGALQWTLNGKKLFYSQGGRPASCTPSGSGAKTHAFRAKMAISHAEEAEQKFNDAARTLGRNFYHPTLKDLDWTGLTDKYRDLVLKTHTYSEFNTVFSLLQGWLNGSHLGIWGPGGGASERIGYLGCEFDVDFPGPGLKIKTITPRSPADRDESRLYPGDVLLTVNGEQVGPDHALDRALIDAVGEQIIVGYSPAPDRPVEEEDPEEDVEAEEAAEEQASESNDAAEEESRDATKSSENVDKEEEVESDEPATEELVIRPISYGAFNRLKYDEWIEANRKYVDDQSGGRVAYAHISGMGESQFHVFERDLYAAAHGKDGLIIDVRNNGGGWTADWVLAVLNVKRHAYTIGRGGTAGYPQGRLIFYAWPKPATMMCNQMSYSNAEIVSHAFKNLGRGPLVGARTFGAVISTGGYGLIDGTFVRMPFRGWYTLPAGEDMENNGAVPDVETPYTPADEQAGRRPQLDAAIKATLEQIEAG